MFLPSNITLKFGDSGDFVAELQRRLAAVGAHNEQAISGSYDGTTVNSVSSFQSRSGLRADGIAGPETLRKLNGVVSGDSSGSTSSSQNEEEKQQQVAAEFITRAVMIETAPEAPIFGARTPEAQIETYLADAPAHVAAQPAQPALSEQQLVQQNIQREIQMTHQQNTSLAPADTLAQMLLQQTAQARQPEPQQQPQQQPVHQFLQAEPQQQAAAATRELTAVAAPEQAKGIVGRAMQKMDGMLQRMSDYFENKLSPDVMREVKQLGQVMLQSGVKETPIPSGPEQARAPAAPARGPDQPQQIPTRG